jgi:hypothetical protein
MARRGPAPPTWSGCSAAGSSPAIALYAVLGRREDSLHFDIAVP